MAETNKTTKPRTKRPKDGRPAAPAERPPESAQNFEHVIRRLVLERERAREPR